MWPTYSIGGVGSKDCYVWPRAKELTVLVKASCLLLSAEDSDQTTPRSQKMGREMCNETTLCHFLTRCLTCLPKWLATTAVKKGESFF